MRSIAALITALLAVHIPEADFADLHSRIQADRQRRHQFQRNLVAGAHMNEVGRYLQEQSQPPQRVPPDQRHGVIIAAQDFQRMPQIHAVRLQHIAFIGYLEIFDLIVFFGIQFRIYIGG